MRLKPRKHALIVAHPSLNSFNLAVARSYEEAVRAFGDDAIVRDLYRIGFDPRLEDEEIPRPKGFCARPDVLEERGLLADADVFCFVYPVWFNAPPAILVGYIQRVFGMGFGYGPQHQGGTRQLLMGRSLISFSSSGAPAEWMRSEGGWSALQNLFDAHVADVCGMRAIEHRHYGRVLAATPANRIEAHLRDVRETVKKHFAPSVI